MHQWHPLPFGPPLPLSFLITASLCPCPTSVSRDFKKPLRWRTSMPVVRFGGGSNAFAAHRSPLLGHVYAQIVP